MLRICYRPIAEGGGSPSVYALLADAYRDTCGGRLPTIRKTPSGKPYFPERPGVHFSLSHSRSHVMCAISDAPVGIDIETNRYISERARHFFSTPHELSLFGAVELWVLKESYVKLFGLSLPAVRGLCFSFGHGRVITPDPSVTSGLYHVDGCPAAVSSFGAALPETVELIAGSSALIC